MAYAHTDVMKEAVNETKLKIFVARSRLMLNAREYRRSREISSALYECDQTMGWGSQRL
jgi:hypothetical protein